MTDKQIIIKDYFNILRDEYNRIYCIQNIGDPKSLIKAIREQNEYIQAKELESERLKEEVSLLKESNSKLQQIEDVSSLEKCYLQQIDQLKAENEKYSLFIEKLCDYIGLESDSEEQAMRTLSDFARQMNKVRWVIDRYKQTLTEIKEIAENMNKECFYDDFDCMNCDMQNGCTYFNKKQILQKISECEVKNEI